MLKKNLKYRIIKIYGGIMLKYILFDLDGTLTDPAEGITKSVNFALSHFGRQVGDRTKLYKYIGPPLVSSLEAFEGLSHEEALLGLSYYRDFFKKYGIFDNEKYDGIDEMLKGIKEESLKIILATSKPVELAEEILRHFSIDVYFDFFAGNNLKEERPTKEQVIEYIIENFPDLSGENAIMVGDRLYDVKGAARFNIKTIGVSYGYGGEEELKAAGAAYIAKNPAEVLKTVKKIKSGVY